MRRILSAVGAAALLAAGLAAAPTTAADAVPSAVRGHHPKSGYHPPPVRWGRCADPSLRSAGARCGMVTVPLDYARPHGTKVKLAVSRVRHTTSAAKAQGVMLVNPGGPGGSGLEYSELAPLVPHNGGAAYDWIGFDPRGVGSSKPSLSCDTDYFAAGRPSYVPSTRQISDYWQRRTSAYVKECRSADLALLRHTGTRTWVKDMESIRKALGVRKISYYGFSYGTYLGAVYASEHPHRVRRFVLDGVVDPRHVWYAANLAQDRQFDLNIDTFFDWVAAHDDTYGLGTDGDAVRQIYYDVLQRLTDHPEPHFGAADWNDVFTSAGYYVYGWDDVAHVLVAAAHGDLGPAEQAYGDPTGAGADNTYANYLAVECADARWPQSWRTWQRDNDALNASHPFLTWNNAWYNAPCRTWPVKGGPRPAVNGKKVPPIMLIEETHDAATPWSGAIEVRKRFPRSVLLEGVGGTTHAGSLSGVGCVDNRIARYLKTGAVPARKPGNGHSDVRCRPVAPPAPTPPGSSARPVPRLRQQLLVASEPR